MTALHAYFTLRNQQAFQRLLDPSRGQHRDSGGLSTSGGKSWSRPSPLSSAPSIDVNARDHLGRTVLHLAASSQDASAPEFVRLLLAHPTINVNVADVESHWTPLHRALYHGNLATAQLLLQRLDIDTALRDIEGYTPFDLYNSTVEGTVPDHFSAWGQELYTWGSNRNAALGVGDGDDRAIPELVSLRVSAVPETDNLDTRFTPIHVRQIAMSRLHTVIVTDEPRANLRVCGFGSGGRLGPGQHTQYTPIPLPGFNLTVEFVAVGQDHTLILTKNGEVHSWGLNRFAQLGYVVETATGGRAEEPIQSTPRKVAGAIRNHTVKGVAACKTASACWTHEEVFTWGTNNGQLGYDRAAQPVQTAPRVVTKINKPVLSVSITDSALACLLETQEVICLWNDGHFKVNFPAYSFPSEFVAYRPPQAANRNSASIDKITSCEDTFAALSSSGELFTFTLPSPSEGGASSVKSRFNVQPQRVWALRKQFSAVRDVALGVDGSIVVCTESGHVFVRSRNLKAGQGSSAKTFKFQRVPYIQRVTQVCANAIGAFAALRSDWNSEEVQVVGNRLSQDLSTVQPVSKLIDSDEHLMGTLFSASGALSSSMDLEQGSDEEEEDAAVQDDVKQLKALASVILRLKAARKGVGGTNGLDLNNMPYGADLVVHVQSNGVDLPAHRVILAARSSVLDQVLSEVKTIRDTKSNVAVQGHATKGAGQKLARVTFMGCHPLTVLILMAYLYSDEPLAVWDHRVSHAIQRQLEQLKAKPAQLKAELQALASLLGLNALSDVLDAPVKRAPKPVLSGDLQKLFSGNQLEGVGARMRRPLAPDVVLQLAEREVYCHSVVLRARSPFFAAFFDDKDWTVNRWTPEGTVVVNLRHMKWRAVEPVLKFICTGGDKEIFDVVEDVRSVDELIDYVFDIMAVANELHVHRLMLICSWVIMKRVWINNVCSVLTDATHYHATALVRLAQEYITVNMEVFLESRMLEDLTLDLIKQLSAFVRSAQAKKYPLSRSSRIVDKAMEAWGDWLTHQDIPQPILPTSRVGAFRDSPKLSPPGPSKRTTKRSDASAPNSPMLRPTFSNKPVVTGIPDDEMFMMDETEAPTTSTPGPTSVSAPGTPPRVPSGSDSPGRPAPVWKPVTSAPKADMKTIMAEASNAKSAVPRSPAAAPARQLEAQRSLSSRPSMESPAKSGSGQVHRVPSGSSWRVPKPAASTPVSSSPTAPSRPSTPSKNARVQPSGAPSAAPSSTGTGGSSTTSRSQPTTPRKPAAPGLGPVFTPTKQASPAISSIRRVSSGNVWTPPPVQPVQPVVQASSPRPAMSFAAIQLSQAQQDAPPPKDKRTLVEIQEEERARQVEEDFLRWWAAEEERLKEEQAAAAALLPAVPRAPKKAKGGQKGKGAAPGGEGRAQQQLQKGGGRGGRTEGAPRQPREKAVGHVKDSGHGTEERQGDSQAQGQQGQTRGHGGKLHRRRPAQTASDSGTAKGDERGMTGVPQLPS